MLHYRTVLAIFFIFFMLPVVYGFASTSIKVPYDAPIGYQVAKAHINGQGGRVSYENYNKRLSDSFQREMEFGIALSSPVSAGRAVAQEQDEDSEDNRKVSYYLIKESPFFAVDPQTGVLYIREMIKEEMTYHLYLSAKDNENPSSSKLPLHVAVIVEPQLGIVSYGQNIKHQMEKNDQLKQARFKRDVDLLAFEVNEHALFGTIIGTVTNYPRPSDKFETDSTLFGVDNLTGNISVQTLLNYEERALYIFTVRIRNMNNSASVRTIQISVAVIDESDPPYWTIPFSQFIAVVPDNAPRNAPVYQLTAADEDRHADIHYYLRTGDGFYIHETTGEIKTKGGFEYLEDDAPYILSVYAEDVNSSSDDAVLREVNGVVTIFVNRHPPQFTAESYEVSVPEGVPRFEVVTVRAISFDNQKLRYSLLLLPQGTPTHNIDEVTGVIEVTQSLDRETIGNYFLEVEATEEGGEQLKNVIRVNVNVADSNDNDPTFCQAAYSFDDVKEDIGLDQIIGSVKAIDPDEDENGKVLYTLSGEDASYFRVDVNGNLYANGTLDFDKRHEVYYFELKASDGGIPPRSSTATVRVRVSAVSDEYPVFTPDMYTYYVDENADVDYTIGKVYASDADGEVITFALTQNGSGSFTVEEDTGVIKLSLRDENDLPDLEYDIVVAATDTAGFQGTAEVKIIVNDNKHNNAPQFLDCESYEPHVTEGRQVIPGEEPVFIQVNATDKDRGPNGELTYRLFWEGIWDNPFIINSETGEITLSFGPDREWLPTYTVTATATDNARHPLTGLCSFKIIVDDVNDSRPRFRRNQYEVTVAANSSITSTVLTVDAEDADLDSTISYYLENNPFFAINSSTGRVIVKSSLLPLKDTAPWRGLIRAIDGMFASQTTLYVTAVDSIDPAPVFEPYQNPIVIPENFSTASDQNTLGQFRARIQSTFGDNRVTYSLLRGARPETNFPVKIGLVNDEHFTMATLKLWDRLDYEKVKQIDLEILAEGVTGSMPSFETVRVLIEDVNDNPPRFPLVIFNATVKENAGVGTHVAHIVANDADSSEEFRQMRYRIDQSAENMHWKNFEINETTGEITTATVLDYEVMKIYVISVIAENVIPLAIGTQVPNRALTSVHIAVWDENDNEPVFAETSYSATVKENITLGDMVISLTASDLDEKPTLRYLFTNGNTNGVFTVDPGTGVISVAGGLDYEKVKNYSLECRASDGIRYATTMVFISVIDVNDEPPEFDRTLYTVSVLEGVSNIIPRDLLQVNAVDGDSFSTTVVYSLDGTGAGDFFTITSNTGLIRINENLDREMQPVYNLVAVARDENGFGLTGYSTVIIVVIDINDWAPHFPEMEYVGSVPENSVVGTTVMEVRAQDRDDPNTRNGRLEYATEPISNDPNDGYDLFAINPDTGVVITKVIGSHLDSETQDTYVMRVTATDGTYTAVTTATITIADINDNRPIFSPTMYSKTVPETLEMGETAVKVMGSDLDTTGRDYIDFVILAGNVDGVFGIYTDTPTLQGLIYPEKMLDFETQPSSYTLQVQVSDRLYTDTATVIISLSDENEPPVFNQLTYTATVPEDLLPGSSILNVTASDEDTNFPNNSIHYFVDHATDPGGLFTIVGNQLQLAPNKNLDRESVDRHSLNILVTDAGSPPLSGTAVVELSVTDVEDTAPKFKEDYKGYVHENYTNAQWVAVVQAVDDDLSDQPSNFSYHILSDQPGIAFFVGFENAGNNSFTVEKRPQVMIDREVNPSFDLIIRITDDNSNSRDNILPIEVLDLNDNPHHPVTKEMLVYALDGAVLNTCIGYVGVDDLDVLEDKIYRVVGGAINYFNVDVHTGLVEIAEGTSATDDGDPYTVRVEVDDGGKFPATTSTLLINIKEISMEAVIKSGSLRLAGVTAEEFISSKAEGSQFQKLTRVLSNITKGESIDIFAILPVKGNDKAVDVRYSAHGPHGYYSEYQLNSVAERNSQLIEEILDVTVESIYINECPSTECEKDCSNFLEIDPEPVVINYLDAAVVGINSYIAPFCGCAARERHIGTCMSHYCHNGGTCKDSASGPRCKCEPGFDGPSCQGTTRSFTGGYALLPTLKQCSETRTSVEFITVHSSGILFYNGPTSNNGTDDYILLKLWDGRPVLSIDLGDGESILEVLNSPPLNDGKWHKVDIFRNELVVELVIDDCKTALLSEDHVSSSTQRDSCSGNFTLPVGDTSFQSTQPLQLGGVSPDFEYPANLGLGSVEAFEGCIRNLDQDSTLYDLYDVAEFANSEPGCPSADKLCSALSPCINGICDGNFFEAKCICNPGWIGPCCNKELDPNDFLSGSYVTYTLKPDLVLTERLSDYKIMVRTRMKTGLIWQITNENKLEHVTMELVNGYLLSSWHLGDGTVSVALDKYPLNNGEWHHITFFRFDNYVKIKVDGGGGVRQVENRASKFRILQVDRESLILGAELKYGVNVVDDFVADNEAPMVVCPDNVQVFVPVGLTSTQVNYSNPTVSDDSGLTPKLVTTIGITSGGVFPVGTSSFITFVYEDAAGNQGNCTLEIQVTEDNSPPEVVFCTPSVFRYVSATNPQSVVHFVEPTATDNSCLEVTLIVKGLRSGSVFQTGVSTTTYTFADSVGNLATCQTEVTVQVDDSPPVITDCPSNIVEILPHKETQLLVTFNAPTATDNSGETRLSGTSGVAENRMYSIGATVITYTFEDNYGNSAICQFTITINQDVCNPSPCAANEACTSDEGIPPMAVCSTICEMEVVNDTLVGRLTFPAVSTGRKATSIELCPVYSPMAGKPRATRTCSAVSVPISRWEEPTLNNCFQGTSDVSCLNDLMMYLKSNPVTKDNVTEVSRNIADATAAMNITGNHLVSVALLLEEVTAVESSSPKVASNVIETVDNVLAAGRKVYVDSDLKEKAPSRILQSLEKQLSNLHDGEEVVNFTDIRNFVGAVSRSFVREDFSGDIVFGNYFTNHSRNLGEYLNESDTKVLMGSFLSLSEKYDNVKAIITLPFWIVSDIHIGSNGIIPVTFIIYRTSHLFMGNSTHEGAEEEAVQSLIISAKIEGQKIEYLEHSVVSTFYQTTVEGEKVENRRCVFWDFSLANGFGDWSDEGCFLASSSTGVYESLIECFCTHLTNFAVIVDTRGDIHNIFPDTLSIIGCFVSIIVLIIVIITFLAVKQLRDKRPQQILLNLWFALLGLYFFFFVGIARGDLPVGCVIFGALIHFFCLASVAWLCVDATNMYLLLYREFDTGISNSIWKACFCAWGLPLFVAIVSAVVKPQDYTSRYCFPQAETLTFYLGVLLLIALMLCYNLVMFILVIRQLIFGRETMDQDQDQDKRSEMYRRVQNAIGILVLLGLTWAFGFLSIVGTRQVFHILFLLFNTLQGLYVLIFVCLRQKGIPHMGWFWLRSRNGEDNYYLDSNSAVASSQGNQPSNKESAF